MKHMLENLQKKSPLVHNITNYVTVNDCANLLIACGASPIMADDVEEVEEITTISTGLNINIGTLNQRTIPAMILAGKKANLLHHPVVFDPVGAGASTLRTETAKKLMDEVNFSVIRGNISELKALSQGDSSTKGVDADVKDAVVSVDSLVSFAKEASQHVGAVVAITGEIDVISDGETAYLIQNGHPMMSKVSGTGCMLSALVGAYISANPDELLLATATAVAAMGVAGQVAFERLKPEDGNSSYRNYIIDAIYNMDGNMLENKVKYEIRR